MTPGTGTTTACPAAGHRRPLAIVLGISGTILVVEVIGAFISGSLALLADAGHMLTDVAGLTLALIAAVLAGRPATDARTWGYRRAEVLAAAAQAAVLLAVGGFVLVEGVRRLIEPPEVASGAMIVFGVVGLVGNIVVDPAAVADPAAATSTPGPRSWRSSTTRSARSPCWSPPSVIAHHRLASRRRRRVAADRRADPAPHLEAAARDRRRAAGGDPEGRRPGRRPRPHPRRRRTCTTCTTCTPPRSPADLPVLTAHVVVDDACFHDGHLPRLLDQLQQCLAGHFDVEHSTFQFEPAGHADHEHAAHA